MNPYTFGLMPSYYLEYKQLEKENRKLKLQIKKLLKTKPCSDHAKDHAVWRITDLINAKLKEYGYQIVVRKMPERDYDDNRVYNTNERQRDTRIDGSGGRREATLIFFNKHKLF